MIKVLTLTEPWATLIMIGAKRYETRGWPTNYRGELAIHAALGFPKWARETCDIEPFKTVLAAAGYHGYKDLPTAAILGTVELYSCERTTLVLPTLEGHEESFGNYADEDPNGRKRYAFGLRDVKRWPKPVHAMGQLGIWNWEPDDSELHLLPEAVRV
jgi:activating signal cointegrator 1